MCRGHAWLNVADWSLRTHEPKDLTQTLAVHMPWSLWHSVRPRCSDIADSPVVGYDGSCSRRADRAVVLVIVSAFAAFGIDVSEPAGVATRVLVIIALIFLASTGVGYAFNTAQGGTCPTICPR